MGRSPSPRRRHRSRSRSRERPRRAAADRSGRGRPAGSPERAGRSRIPVSPERGGRSRPGGSPDRGRARQASPPARDRSRERRRHRHDREASPEASVAPKPRGKALPERPAITQADLEGKSPEEQEMIRVMGFGGFDTTKGKKVENNEAGEVQVVLKRKYRQYMNRKGGFNRPLDFVA